MKRVFHKYRSDNKFTEEIITSGEVFLATAHQLNDPFECSLQEISKEWMEKQINDGMQAALAGFVMTARRSKEGGQSFFDVSPSLIEQTLDALFASEDLEATYEAMRDFLRERTGHLPSDCRRLYNRIDNQLTQVGIFSMSADPAQPLMWAHYAGDHHGLCLGFREFGGSKLNNSNHCLPVIYSDELPSLEGKGLRTELSFALDERGRPYTTGLKVAFSDETFQRVISTKPTCWFYEQEVRYIEPYSGLIRWPGRLSECTFGLRCPDERREYYVELLRDHVPNEVFLFEMKMRPGTNALVRVPTHEPRIEGRKRRRKKIEARGTAKVLSAEAFNAKMQQFIQQGRFGEVIFQVDENLKRDPTNSYALLWKATAYGHSLAHNKALEIYRELTGKHPDMADAWYGMACALGELGCHDEALVPLEHAYRLEPNDPSHALNLGLHLIRRPERKKEGLNCLRRAERLGHRRARRLIEKFEGH